MDGVERVRRLFYSVEDGDRLVAVRNPHTELPALKLHTRRMGPLTERRWAIASATACIAGVALVWTPEELTAVGTEPSLSFWKWPYPVAALDEALDLVQPLDTKLRRAHEVRSWRVPQLAIQHKVAELFPDLRIKPGHSGYDPKVEIQLRPHHGGRLLLGGCVWRPEYYFCGQAKKDLQGHKNSTRL